MLDALPFVAVDLVLGIVAVRRPWVALVALLGVLPVNGALTQVVPRLFGLSNPAQIALAAWHDALVAGIALAGLLALVRARERSLDLVEWLIAAILAVGLVYVAVSPVTFTAFYVYRVLYEPPLLLAAITVLARYAGTPGWIPARAALALILSSAISALYAWPQVYVFRFSYLQKFYTDPGDQIHHSFLAHGLNQPRAIGLLHSPNEFGAALAIAIALLVVPGLLRIRDWMRAWLLAILAMALLISFSRSAWLATLVSSGLILWLSRAQLRSLIAVRPDSRRRTLLTIGAPILASVILTIAVFTTSGAAALVKATATGNDPSVGNRPHSVRAGLTVLFEHPLGLGLGTAGPKAARFDETQGRPRILTETWYILYAIQVGLIGFGLLAVTAVTILRRLWTDRLRPISRAAFGIAFGLGVGAIFIPVIEDPTVSTPLWAIIGLALAGMAVTARGGGATDPS
ncbi:MAG TPA: O-antigen ligase family protein [Methylomirabilota bacterium]|nr:O-antigen ligase family protein [Methylomirabilota bacterium]